MSQNFWSDAKTEPKRKFRYLLYFAGMPQFIAKTVSKPSFQVGTTAHSFLQHNFNFPGRVTWQDVSITIVDPIQPDATQTLYSILEAAGYVLPPNVNRDAAGKETITKKAMVEALNPVRIDTIGPSGADEILESWTLNNAQISSVNFNLPIPHYWSATACKGILRMTFSLWQAGGEEFPEAYQEYYSFSR